MDLLANIVPLEAGLELSISRQDMQLQPHQQALLKQPAGRFLLCEDITATEAHLILTYHKPDNYIPFSQIKMCTQLEKYLILIRVGRFVADLKKRYSTSFDPRNIFFTRTLDVAFMLRVLPGTIPQWPRTPLDEFNDFKALVLSVLQDKYSFTQLEQCGPEIVTKTPLTQALIQAQNPQELEKILTEEYERTHLQERQNRVGLSKKLVITAAVAACLLVSVAGVSAFLAYDNMTQNRINFAQKAIYESYYSNDQAAIVENAQALKNENLDTNLGKIVAEALIATKEPENLYRAFSLDPSRRLEVVDRLILLQEYDRLIALPAKDPLTQVYQAYYAKDYSKVIASVENNAALKTEPRAQILLAKACVSLNNYTRAEAVLLEMSQEPDLESYVSAGKQSWATAMNQETDLDRRELTVLYWDDIIRLCEDILKAKTK
ncbi:MAG: hypothetical protein FWG40_06530 [Peptococcaceae bacterium]|nr:hypothetical protein [Peptococcaceae bacterium]